MQANRFGCFSRLAGALIPRNDSDNPFLYLIHDLMDSDAIALGQTEVSYVVWQIDE